MSRLATLGELTASIAHEVNQPLAGVVANGEAALRWMRREPSDLVEVELAVNRMIADGRRASEVVNRVRGLVGRRTPIAHRAVKLNDAIEETLQLLRSEFAIHRIRVESDLAGDLPPVIGDRVQIQQVLINLIVNAIQAAADEEGSIRIRSGRDGETAFVEIADQGRGIDPAVAGRLFDAFVTTKPTGMGIGLSICRTIIEAHGGTIAAIPVTGRGSAFRITLPLSEERRER